MDLEHLTEKIPFFPVRAERVKYVLERVEVELNGCFSQAT